MMKINTFTYYLSVILALLCLAIGGLIYLLFRSRTLLMFEFIPAALINTFDAIHENLNIPCNQLTSFAFYSLPDGLWTISYLIIMHLIWMKSVNNYKMIWIYSLPVMLLVIEIFQILPSFPGTFDWLDIFCYTLPIIVSLLIDIDYGKIKNSFSKHCACGLCSHGWSISR